MRLFFFRDVGRGTRDLGRGTRPRPRKSGRLMLRVLLYTIRCSLPPSLKLRRARFTVYCSLFTKKLFAIRYWLFAIYCSLNQEHTAIALLTSRPVFTRRINSSTMLNVVSAPRSPGASLERSGFASTGTLLLTSRAAFPMFRFRDPYGAVK